MNKYLKGCLITLIILIVLIGVGIFLLFHQMDKPGEINYSKDPISNRVVEKKLKFSDTDIPKIINELKDTAILYQAMIEEYGLDKSTIYKVLYKTNSAIRLENKLPLDLSRFQIINSLNENGKIVNERFDYKVPNDQIQRVENGVQIKIFSRSIDTIMFDLLRGSYSIKEKSIDKVGMIRDILIFDSTNNYFYFERYKYDAFQ